MQSLPPNVGKHRFSQRSSNDADLCASLLLPCLKSAVEDWLLDGRLEQQSPRTIIEKKNTFEKLFWFLEKNRYASFGEAEIKRFLLYVMNGHQDPDGRWGNPHMTKPVGAKTLKNYYIVIQTFCNWAVREEVLEVSPILRIPVPKVPKSQIQPFTDEHIEALVAAARYSRHSKRNEAIVVMLLDTGLRASELCGLRLCDFDLERRHCTVIGKGNKKRTVFYGLTTGKALWAYLRHYRRSSEDLLWLSLNGRGHGEPMQRNTLYQAIEELGKDANIQGVRCSPHTFRHTFAVNFLRNGGNVFSLQQLLGHSTLSVTQRYISLAEADVQAQHRLYSPADHFARRQKNK